MKWYRDRDAKKCVPPKKGELVLCVTCMKNVYCVEVDEFDVRPTRGERYRFDGVIVAAKQVDKNGYHKRVGDRTDGLRVARWRRMTAKEKILEVL